MIFGRQRAIGQGSIVFALTSNGGDAQSWLNLQAIYDLKLAEQQSGEQISKDISPHAA